MQLHRNVSLIALLALSCTVATATRAQAPQRTGVIFENVRIFNGTSDRLSAPSNVLVVGNIIKTISSAPIPAPPGTPIERIQGGGRTLMPGLIDNHVHITMSASSQRDLVDPNVSVETLQSRATEEAKQMLLRGFTAVRDMGALEIALMMLPTIKIFDGADSRSEVPLKMRTFSMITPVG